MSRVSFKKGGNAVIVGTHSPFGYQMKHNMHCTCSLDMYVRLSSRKSLQCIIRQQ